MIERRSVLGFLGTCTTLGLQASASAAAKRDKACRGKAIPLLPNQSKASNSGIGVGGKFNHYGEAIIAVHRDFQAIIENNFLIMPRATTNRFIESLTQQEINFLFTNYSAASLNSAQPGRLLEILAPSLDRQQTQRLVGVVGFESAYQATLRSAPTKAQFVLDALYSSNPKQAQQAYSTAGYNENPLDYTIKEIYLSYRTAPKGSFSVGAAMYETASFAGTRLVGAFSAGYALGTAIQKTWEYLSPNTWNSFSNFVGSTVNSFASSVGSIIGTTPFSSISSSMDFQIGGLQENLWSDFQQPGPMSWYMSGGDFGATSSWGNKTMSADCK